MPTNKKAAISVGDRLISFMHEQGYHSQLEFCLAINESYSNFNKFVNGHRLINKQFIDKLVMRFPDIDLNWLLKEDWEGLAKEDLDLVSNEILNELLDKILQIKKFRESQS